MKNTARENVEIAATLPAPVLYHRRPADVMLPIVCSFAISAAQFAIVKVVEKPFIAAVFV